MAPGPSDPPRRPQDGDPDTPEEPRISHSPPGPSDDSRRGMPLASPWGMPPFAAPTPEDEEPPDPPRGRRPYSSPTAEPESPPRRRRVVNRPDKLVAGGPPREPAPEPPTEERHRPPYREPPYHLPEPVPVEPEHLPGEDAPREGEVAGDTTEDQHPAPDVSYDDVSYDEDSYDEDVAPVHDEAAPDHDEVEASGEDEAVRRVGRPPGGRPTRPDLLVASGPPRPTGSSGRHHRGPLPAALRRSLPKRRRRVMMPIALLAVLALVITAGVIVWRDQTTQETGLRLAAGVGRAADDLFTVPSAGDGSNQKLMDLASVGKAVVAVGSDTTSPTPRPLFLFSPDGGRSWQLGQVTGESGTSTVQRVVGGNGLWLASGGDEVGGARGLWTSADGFSWTAVEQSGLTAFRGGDLVYDIARTGSGFVAVGRTTLEDGSAGPAAWQSADGRAWERVDTRGLDVRELRSVVARGDTVVALAQPAQGSGSRVVRSVDGGRGWQATPFLLPEAEPRTGTLAVLPKQFVLVPVRSRTSAGDVRVYCSQSGTQWAQCGSIHGLSGQSPGIDEMISYRGGIAAVAQANLGKYAVLTSGDGRGWAKRAELGNLSGATLRGFAIADSGTLFAGGDQAAADVDNQIVLMTAPPRGAASRVPLNRVDGLTRIARETARLANHAGRYVAVGSASGDAAIWTSLNWKGWTSMSLGGPRQQSLSDVVYGRRGWLAVGSTQTDVSVTEPLLVGSSDGRTWKQLAATGDLARDQGHPYLDLHAAAAGQKGYVLAGESRDASGTAAAALWFTPDLRKFTKSKKLPQGGSGVRVHAVAATSTGYVAVGGSGTGEQESSVVWTSEDGVNWTPRKRVSPPDASAAGLRQITAYGDRLVAIGVGNTDRPFSAVSEDDGKTWTTAWMDESSAVTDLAATSDGLVAVGWHGRPGEADSAAWTSTDGQTWTRHDLTTDRLAGQGMQWLAAVTIAGRDVVALGRSTTYNADHLTLWTSTLTP
ncbi:hypothetical protein [Nonomuraea sediminis]|uniref:hypothetical protein n=1 Tax=Nonomuraea sediminis TaxID=2835864 RepID=UPI001BDD32CF|nr:hypothetical protein [Nonomuraea sediminis]